MLIGGPRAAAHIFWKLVCLFLGCEYRFTYREGRSFLRCFRCGDEQ